MKLYGICNKSLEEVEKGLTEDTVAFTYWEFIDLYKAKKLPKDKNILIVDVISKLLTINDLPFNADYYNYAWKPNNTLDYTIIEFADLPEELSFQQRIFKDWDLKQHNYLTHLTEFQADVIGFCNKIHNLLTKTSKEKIECSEVYKQKMKENLINEEMSGKYQQYIDKKLSNPPEIFKFIKFNRDSVYSADQGANFEEGE